MYLFIGNLTPETTPLEVAKLFSGFKHSGFRVEHKQLRSGETIHFAVGRLESERAGRKAIRKLDGAQQGEARLVVREFAFRAASNDRRSINWRLHRWNGSERRQQERRVSERVLREDEFGIVVGHFAAFRDGSLF